MNINIPSFELPEVKISEPIKPHINIPRSAVLVLGNGFDLCAGLRSSLKSFALSEYWPIKNPKQMDSLAYRLDSNKNAETWFDLEQQLFYHGNSYETKHNIHILEDDKKTISDVHVALSRYLLHEESSFEVASTIPKMLIDFFQVLPGKSKNIFTFNYTSPDKIIKRMGGKLNVPVKYVHGSLAENNIILGVGDHNELHDRYHFLYKAMSPHYKSSEIVSTLEAADDVFFFGHSMGMNDYDYFNHFFIEACEKRNGLRNDLRITFFIRSLDDQLQLKSRIRELSDKKLQRLINMCSFNIVPTDDEDRFITFLANYFQSVSTSK